MRSTRVGRVGCGVAAALLMAGCGSSTTTPSAAASGTNAPATSSAAPTSAAPTTPPPPTAAQLQAVVVQPGDLPAGWSGEPYQADPGDAADQAAFLKCVGGRDTGPDQVAEQHSPDFSTSDGAGVSSSATAFRSEQDIADDVAVLKDPKASACFQEEARTVFSRGGLPPGATLGTPTIAIVPGSNGGPSNVVATGSGTVPLTVSGHRITLHLAVAFITGRMTESEVDVFSVGQPFPAALQQSLIAAVATRTAAL